MLHLTEQDAARIGIADAGRPQNARSPVGRSKYRAQRVRAYGRLWASKAECRHYGELLSRGEAGEIRNLELQPRYPLSAAGVPVAVYIGDFAFDEWCPSGWRAVVVDVKGFATPLYRLKARLFRLQYPHLIFREVR